MNETLPAAGRSSSPEGDAPPRSIVYFSMEIGLEPGIPTYAGGLGVLAGDTIRAAADLNVPMVAVTLLHRRGYFLQSLDPEGGQREEPMEWPVDDYLEPTGVEASVSVTGREVRLTAWRRDVPGSSGFAVPVYFIDADLEGNHPEDRELTHWLYGGGSAYRLRQEVILGVGGVRLLRAMGHRELRRFHMNEGHSSFLTAELFREAKEEGLPDDKALASVRERCVFTTHTPVEAGHDRFPMDDASAALGDLLAPAVREMGARDGHLNMTWLALNLSHYVNGVAKKHGEVSRSMFAPHVVDAITNGVHLSTWAAPSIAALFDRRLPHWRESYSELRTALAIPAGEILEAHMEAKKTLLGRVNHETGAGLDKDVFTIGFARRMTAYKQPDLIFTSLERLKKAASAAGRIQMVFAGKAHPRDEGGKDLIRFIFRCRKELGHDVRVAFLPNYDMELGRLITSGVDLWLNNPSPPMEASGTSGMKAALNGVPSLSILDGWWIEGHVEGVTGWSVEPEEGAPGGERERYAGCIYRKLESLILPLYYGDSRGWAGVMLHAISLNGAWFNTHRMVRQYVLKAYL